MPSEDYHKAMRQGLKEVKAAQALGEETGPRTLPDAPEKLAVRRESLGLGGDPRGADRRHLQPPSGGRFLPRVLPYPPGGHRVRRQVERPVPHPPGGGHPGPCQGGGVPQPLLCDGGPQAGQRAEVFRRYYYPGHCHPPAAQAV